jgi:hypothetical protein
MASSTKKQAAKSLEDFRKSHDKSFIVPAKIKAGIELLGPGGWEYETAFWKTHGINNTDGARFREEFEEFMVRVEAGRKGIICGSKALATKMREMI